MEKPDVDDGINRQPEKSADALDPRSRRLGDAQRRIAELARRHPDDLPSAAPDAVATELAQLAQELAVAHEQLRRQTRELGTARELLEAERARFRELFEVAPEGHVITDVSGNIRESNRAAASLLNIPPAYLVGKPLAVFIDPEDRRTFRLRTYRSRTQGSEEAWTVTLLPRDSDPIKSLVAVSPLLDADGAISGLRFLLRDVSNKRVGTVWERTPAAILRSAIDALSAHVVVIDADGTIVTANGAWRNAPRPAGLFTPSGTGANYLRLCETAAAEGHVGARRILSAVLAVLDGKDTSGEVAYTDACEHQQDLPDNHNWFTVRATRCEGPDPLLIVVAHEDVTAQHRAHARETALITERSARAAAEAANRAKSEFLATLSHELRTPLNAIAGYAQLLEMGVRGPVTPEQAEDLRRILRSEQHLLRLINDLLNFARIERGEVTIEVEPVRVVDVTRDVVELAESQAASKGLAVTLECEDEHLVASADPERLRQILLNLLTNALKFTPKGGQIRVSCKATAGNVSIAVHDTGIGIPRAKQQEVFDPFVQVDRGPGAPSEGIGLGLAISRGLARAMGGDVTVRSDIGKGSTFEVSLSRVPSGAALS